MSFRRIRRVARWTVSRNGRGINKYQGYRESWGTRRSTRVHRVGNRDLETVYRFDGASCPSAWQSRIARILDFRDSPFMFRKVLPFLGADRGCPFRFSQLGTECQLSEFYHGTVNRLAPGAVSSGTVLDVGRLTCSELVSTAVFAATSVLDATVIAAIRCYSEAPPIAPAVIHVYRVRIRPIHTAPVAVLEEMRRRARVGMGLERLRLEYWNPTGNWHLHEVLAPQFTVLQEVPAADPASYIPRWVHYYEDCNRAALL